MLNRRNLLATLPAALVPTIAATGPDERWAEETMKALLDEAAGLEGSTLNGQLLAIIGLCVQIDVHHQAHEDSCTADEYDRSLARLEAIQREAGRRMARDRPR